MSNESHWPTRTVHIGRDTVECCDLRTIAAAHGTSLDRLPYTVRVLLDNVVRLAMAGNATAAEVAALAGWAPNELDGAEFPHRPTRLVLQDFTGVPALVDLAAMRLAAARLGLPAGLVDARLRADLVVDHSVQVDEFGHRGALRANVALEYERNAERYAFLRWADQAFAGVRVVPPGSGIVHQVNLERLATVVDTGMLPDGRRLAFPETVLGTDSHTTMVNGLGVLGWGIGGIEAEALLLGNPLRLLRPNVVGLRLTGRAGDAVTATDIVLTVTQLLRAHGVVGSHVEFSGVGVGGLSATDRATLANMAPEYGATSAMFPVDAETVRYLRDTGRDAAHCALVEQCCRAQGLWREPGAMEPDFDRIVELDLSSVRPCVAGPGRPQDRVALADVPAGFEAAYPGQPGGDVVLAAITSCTNTSNPSVMVAAGLLAKRAVELGLRTPATVKTSMAPGSVVVTSYLERAGLLPYLDKLGFTVVGYGCTSCHGMSGPLVPEVADHLADAGAIGVAVLSGNRNFEGRVHPQARASYLASPPLVVAYALAGSVRANLATQPLGHGHGGRPVFLADVWPSSEEVSAVIAHTLDAEMFTTDYADLFTGDENWRALPTPDGEQYQWDADSTYIRLPPFFDDVTAEPTPPADILGARPLVVLGDNVTTDHISPVGAIAPSSAAGRYLAAAGVDRRDFNSYGTRRGNHEVMVRGTFGNIRLRNEMVPDRVGPWTLVQPEGQVTDIHEAACRYRERGVPLVVIAGAAYGCGSSRDWAAKGTRMLGVRAVLAESFERIHRGNLVGMGVLPLQFAAGESRCSHGVDGTEMIDIIGLDRLVPGGPVTIRITRTDGTVDRFEATARLDSPVDLDHYRHGGVLPHALRHLDV